MRVFTQPIKRRINLFKVNPVYHKLLKRAEPECRKLSDSVEGFGGLYENYYYPLIKRFLLFVLDLPASVDYHHTGPGGLFLHSLETAVEAAREYKKAPYLAEGELDRALYIPKWQYAYFASALLHDIGKVVNFQVVSPEIDGPQWDPYEGGLYDFWARHGQPNISWADKKYRTHENLWFLFVHHVLTSKDIQFLGEKCAATLGRSLQPHGQFAGAASLRMRKTTVAGDMATTKNDVASRPETIRETERFLEDFLLSVRRLSESGGHSDSPNHRGSWYYVGSKYTAFSSPAFIKTIIGRGVNKAEYSFLKRQKDPGLLLLDVQNVLVGAKAALCWGPEKKAVWKMRFNPDRKDGKAYPLSVMFLDNQGLWGDNPPPVYTGAWEILEGKKFAWVESLRAEESGSEKKEECYA